MQFPQLAKHCNNDIFAMVQRNPARHVLSTAGKECFRKKELQIFGRRKVKRGMCAPGARINVIFQLG